jgi:hypothetical protein
MTEQSEWATDIVFRTPELLAQWYPRWIRHAIDTLGCKDVLRYLGKQVPAHSYGNCRHEAKIDLRTRREGTRLKFWYGTNSLKLYDKEAPLAGALRLETTINDPTGYQVYRTKEAEPDGAAKSWQQLRKGVADLGRRAEVSQACNQRLADGLASVAETTPLGKLLEPLSKPVRDAAGHRPAGAEPNGGGRWRVAALPGTGRLLDQRVSQPGPAQAAVPSHDRPPRAAAASGGADAQARVVADARVDREGAKDASLPPQCPRPTRDHGAGGRLPRRRNSAGQRRIKSLPHARISVR